MPRNASGIYTLPGGNPVTPGDVIEASWANTTLEDVADALTNSLSRTGAGGMLAPFRIADGNISAPGLSYLNETNTGLYRSGSGSTWMAVLGVNVAQFSTVGLTVPFGKALTAAGNASVAGTFGVTGATTLASTLAVTGAITATGGVSGNVTGNVTAASGTSSFNDVVISGSLDMTAGSSATITGLSTPTNASDAANKGYVDTQDALRLALTGGTMSGAIAMGSSKITGLATPTADADAATKAYVDSVAQGLDVKGSCRVATVANITLSGTQTIDGVAVIAGDRVLVKDQSTAANNGIYVVAAGSWSRAADADTWSELVGAFTFVEEGTVNDNSGWVCTSPAGGTLGVTAVTWEQFSGAGQITAGAGMYKSGNTLNVGTASSSRIVVGTDDIDLATTGVTASTYKSVTVDAYGRVTAGTNPTTLAGFGITDAYTQAQVNTALALKLNLTGGTMSGAIAMGTNKITGLGDPTLAQDAATKNYIDTIFGSTTSAAASAAAAASSASAAATSATNAASSATSAAGSATSAASSYTTFNNQYLGSKASDPSTNNTGGALVAGNLYWNSTTNEMRVYSGSAWTVAYVPSGSYMDLTTNQTAAGVKTFSSNPILSGGTANGVTYLNGSKVLTSGSALTFDGTNLGVGATTLSYKLEVGSTSDSVNSINIKTSTTGTSNLFFSDTNNGQGGITYNHTSDYMRFLVADAEQMRLTSTGLGIGTSSITSGYKLDVNGKSYLRGTVAIAPSNVVGGFLDSSAAGTLQIGSYNGTGANAGTIIFTRNATLGDVETARFDSAGNLGLGVTPSGWTTGKALEVNAVGTSLWGAFGNTYLSNNYYYNGSDRFAGTGYVTQYIQVPSTGKHQWMVSTASGTAGTIATLTQAMTLDASGNLGIGTSSPDTRLVSNYGSLTTINTSDIRTISALTLTANDPGSVTSSSGVALTLRPISNRGAVVAIVGYESSTGKEDTGTMAFLRGGGAYPSTMSESMRLDSAGNLGLGVTPSAWRSNYKAIQAGNGASFSGATSGNTAWMGSNWYVNSSNVDTYIGTGQATVYAQGSGQHLWYTASSGTAGTAIPFTQAMTLDASGNLLVGKTTTYGDEIAAFYESANGSRYLYVENPNSGTSTAAIINANAGSGGDLRMAAYGTNHSTQANNASLFNHKLTGSLLLGTEGTERARIDSSGNLLVGVTSGSSKLYIGSDTTSYSVTTTNANASPAGYRMYYGNATAPNNTGNLFLLCDDSSTIRASIRSNGGIANYSANNVNLSDRREKTNFAPAGSYLDKICAIPVQTFNYIDQNLEEDGGLTLGVVAQDVQAVAPELVMESNWGTEEEPKMRLSIYQTDLQYALMKALQELKAEFDAYKASHP